MFFRLLLLFTVVPALELFLLIQLGRYVGFWPTAALVLGTGVVGAWLTRREGLKVLRAVNTEMAEGRMPTDYLLDGLLILLAGAVLLTPGLLTDAVGFVLLAPPARRVIRGVVSKVISKRITTSGPVTMDGQWRRVDE
ncbi:MAG: membrane protein FxsA [Acidobacteria bacterium]|nr:MAG: membrane protein FxsA [Acidobacteriota bacterium]